MDHFFTWSYFGRTFRSPGRPHFERRCQARRGWSWLLCWNLRSLHTYQSYYLDVRRKIVGLLRPSWHYSRAAAATSASAAMMLASSTFSGFSWLWLWLACLLGMLSQAFSGLSSWRDLQLGSSVSSGTLVRKRPCSDGSSLKGTNEPSVTMLGCRSYSRITMTCPPLVRLCLTFDRSRRKFCGWKIQQLLPLGSSVRLH